MFMKYNIWPGEFVYFVWCKCVWIGLVQNLDLICGRFPVDSLLVSLSSVLIYLFWYRYRGEHQCVVCLSSQKIGRLFTKINNILLLQINNRLNQEFLRVRIRNSCFNCNPLIRCFQILSYYLYESLDWAFLGVFVPWAAWVRPV